MAHVSSLAHSYTSTDPNNSLNTFNVHHSIHNMAHEPETRAPEATPTTRPLASEPLSEPNFYGDAARRTRSPTRTATAVQGIPAAHAETHKQAHSAIATVLSDGAKMRPKRGPIPPSGAADMRRWRHFGRLIPLRPRYPWPSAGSPRRHRLRARERRGQQPWQPARSARKEGWAGSRFRAHAHLGA